MKEELKISVIIPVYNSEKFLERLLESITQQTYKNYEIIIVNDGSTDRSLEIIDKYNSDNLKCITINNSGPGVARKMGFELATGELLFFIDSDDMLPNKNVFEKIVRIYHNNEFDILFFNFIQKRRERQKKSNTFEKSNMKEGLYNSEYLKKHAVGGALWEKVFVKSKMKLEYFCDSKNYEDYYTTYLYFNDCKNFYYTKEIFYYADRDNENSISKKIDATKIKDTVNLIKITYEKTNYKFIFSKIMYYYYMGHRRKIDRKKVFLDEKEETIRKLKELKKYFDFKTLIKMRLPIKEYFKYIYYEIKDKINKWRKK